MRLLLDTHAFLWFVLDDPQLSAVAKVLINDPASDVLVSPATYWEIVIKMSTGKYTLRRPYEDFVRDGIGGNDFEVLPIEPRHTAALVARKTSTTAAGALPMAGSEVVDREGGH